MGWITRSALFGIVSTFAVVGCGGPEAAPSSSEGEGSVITGAGGSGGWGSRSSGGPPASITTAGAGGEGSSGGAGPSCPAVGSFDAPPLDVPANEWTWVPVEGARCRDGSQTGFGIRKNPGSSKLFIYLEGGGACFNGTTCAIALPAFGEVAFDGWKSTIGSLGVFDAAMDDNPLRDWSAVYVPYCTGDVHAGDREDVDVPGGPSEQHFVGYRNVGKFVERLRPTFEGATHVVVTGVSAGGFGAALNYDRIASAFCPTPVTLLDDSGPPMADDVLAPCLQQTWRTLWNLDATLPADCTECKGANGGGIVNYANYLARKWPAARFGLISSTHDAVISTFFGFGQDGCSSIAPIPPDEYESGLFALRSRFQTMAGEWATYYVDSTAHTYLELPTYYTTTVEGEPLTSWVDALVNGQPANVGP